MWKIRPWHIATCLAICLLTAACTRHVAMPSPNQLVASPVPQPEAGAQVQSGLLASIPIAGQVIDGESCRLPPSVGKGAAPVDEEASVRASQTVPEDALHPQAPFQPLPKGKLEIAVDARSHRLLLLVDGYPVRTFAVAVGTRGSPSPIGEWRITEKSANWGGGFGSRWLGLNVPWGIYGIHGTNKPWSIGKHISSGCIRMRNRDVEELYGLIPIGTPVTIFGDPVLTRRALVNGHRGADVRDVQLRLRELKYYHGPLDGIFGASMERAVLRFQKDHRLRMTGIIRYDTYKALGLGP